MKMGGSTVPERVSQVYYTYGLFCSCHPVPAISVAVSLVLLCCYPLLNIPLPGTVPTVLTVPVADSATSTNVNLPNVPINLDVLDTNKNVNYESSGNSSSSLGGLLSEIQKLPYLWASDKPLVYVQQIILKIGVTPWNSNLLLWDAFRAPIQEVYRLLEIIRNHQESDKSPTFSDLCYHVDTVKRLDYKEIKEQAKILPEYSCLMLSPANLWQQNLQKFAMDASVVNTIFSYQNLQKGRVSTAEMAFGMQLRDTGIKRYPLRSRPRALQYAVTLFYQHFDERYLNSLKQKLLVTYPLHQDLLKKIEDHITVTYYPGKFNYHELVPLLISFVGLFLYVYFSVRKIEFVKSKFGLALCSVITIAGSLSMSMGLCFFFGHSLSLQGKEIYPYLVILVGLENVLVLTKSVTSTDLRLDVKIRLAQGLSKEGWSITKNLLIEITILTVSLFTFVPVIQEFSIFMIVSLICDFVIQMIFFATILGIDMRRMEYSAEKNNKLQFKQYFNSTPLNWRFANSTDIHVEENLVNSPQKIVKSKSHPRLSGLANNTPTDVLATPNSPSKHDKKLPKRIRLVNIWARTRFFQRAFMVWMVMWISIIVYNSGIIEIFIDTMNSEKANTNNKNVRHYDKMKDTEILTQSQGVSTLFDFYNHTSGLHVATSTFSPTRERANIQSHFNDTIESISLKHNHHSQPWRRLSKYHWSSILSQYNISIAGKYVATLPPLLLSCRISPETAVTLRHPDEKDPPPLRWQALAAALDPIDIITDLETEAGQSQQWRRSWYSSELPIYPTTPMEILLLAILCSISVLVIAYTMVVFYKLVCTRNYAEWRASWSEKEDYLRMNSKNQQLVMEAVPLVVCGHAHEVECLATDGERIVSSCLQGILKVWDARSGVMLTKIDRFMYFKLQKDLYDKMNIEILEKSSMHRSNSECGLPTKDVFKTFKHLSSVLTPVLKTNLKLHLQRQNYGNTQPNIHLHLEHLPTRERTKYQFMKSYRELFTTEPSSKNISDIKPQDQEATHKDNETEYSISHMIHSDQKRKMQTSDVDGKVPSLEYEVIPKINDRNTTNVLRNRIKDKFVYPVEHNFTCSEIEEPTHRKTKNTDVDNFDTQCESSLWEGKPIADSPVWCMDFSSDLIILGCADGKLEFWEASSGKLMCVWSDGWSGEESGVTCVRALGGARRVCAAALSGRLLLLRLDVYDPTSGVRLDWTFSTAHRKTHIRTGSAGSIQTQPACDSDRNRLGKSPPHTFTNDDYNTIYSDYDEEVRCLRIAHCKPHQQPISVMEAEGGRIITGGQDHILKVFSSANLSQLFTLHGHCGPVTSCFIDRMTPTIGGSGSQDGLLCVWELNTGTCLYSMQAHDGAVTSLSYTASYVISAGSDEKLCIWDRFQGHMLNSIHIGINYTSNMLPLTHSLLLMGDLNGVTVFDLSSADIARRVLLGQNDGCVFVKQIRPLKDGIVCDYGNQLRIVRFPLVSKLTDTKTD